LESDDSIGDLVAIRQSILNRQSTIHSPIGTPVANEQSSVANSICSLQSEIGNRPRYNPQTMRIAIGADHAGFALKQHVLSTLVGLGHEVDDRGTNSDAPVDYPPICADVARQVAAGRADRGIVIGGSGQGEQMAANKVHGIRAALCNDLYTARMAREHNDANVLALGGRIVAFALADEIVALWLRTAFEGGRHQRRIDQIAALEERSQEST
jgi:ribose 5-phosphate isomerase B